MELKSTKPILKWAGGKRQLIAELKSALPPKGYNRYIEPFVGGGALLFALQPAQAIINDFNWELTNMYTVIREHSDELISVLAEYKEKHDENFYYHIRGLDRTEEFENLSAVKKAARTIYLNRTCYNGLFRVNRQGYFNTPIGRYNNPLILDEDNIRAVQEYLKRRQIEIKTGDFATTALLAEKKDFVYLDPPYYPMSKTSSFTDYTSVGFGKEEQERLKTVCDLLDKKGAFFLQSNSDCEHIRNLYKGYYFRKVEVKRAINSKKECRGNIAEVLISNYPI